MRFIAALILITTLSTSKACPVYSYYSNYIGLTSSTQHFFMFDYEIWSTGRIFQTWEARNLHGLNLGVGSNFNTDNLFSVGYRVSVLELYCRSYMQEYLHGGTDIIIGLNSDIVLNRNESKSRINLKPQIGLQWQPLARLMFRANYNYSLNKIYPNSHAISFSAFFNIPSKSFQSTYYWGLMPYKVKRPSL